MIENHKIELVPLIDIKTDGDNPNIMSKDEEQALKISLEKFGNVVPIIIDKDNIVADGEHRLIVYKKLGVKEIPCIRLENIDETDRKVLRQVMNKLRGKHDRNKDVEEFKKIIKNNGDMDLMSMIPNERQHIKDLINIINTKTEGQELLDRIENVDKLYKIKIECPKCGFIFTKKDT